VVGELKYSCTLVQLYLIVVSGSPSAGEMILLQLLIFMD